MDGKALQRFGRGKVARHREQEGAPPAQPSAVPQLSAPPPGFAWAWMGNQYVLVPLQQQVAPAPVPYAAPGMVYPAPPAYQQPAPQVQPHGPGAQVIPLRPKTNFLVRDSGDDLWAKHLEKFPDLPVQQAPGVGQYDAMDGRPSPLSEAELQPLLNEDPEARAAHAFSRDSMEVPRNFRPAPTLQDKGNRED